MKIQKNKPLDALIEIHPCLSDLDRNDLGNNFVEIIEQFAAERAFISWLYSGMFDLKY